MGRHALRRRSLVGWGTRTWGSTTRQKGRKRTWALSMPRHRRMWSRRCRPRGRLWQSCGQHSLHLLPRRQLTRPGQWELPQPWQAQRRKLQARGGLGLQRRELLSPSGGNRRRPNQRRELRSPGRRGPREQGLCRRRLCGTIGGRRRQQWGEWPRDRKREAHIVRWACTPSGTKRRS